MELYSRISRAERIRVRDESENKFLLYNPRTDELHIVSELGKRLFDLCDGREIDEIVRFEFADHEAEISEITPDQILGFLCELKKRDLVVVS